MVMISIPKWLVLLFWAATVALAVAAITKPAETKERIRKVLTKPECAAMCPEGFVCTPITHVQ